MSRERDSYPKKEGYGFIKRKKVNLSEKTRPAGRPMETIVLSDDEEDPAPRTGLCIHCGQVSKPHACPHGTVKIMKPLVCVCTAPSRIITLSLIHI